jgi:hypothetical protein
MPDSSLLANMAKGETAVTGISHSPVLPFPLSTADKIGLQTINVKKEYVKYQSIY